MVKKSPLQKWLGVLLTLAAVAVIVYVIAQYLNLFVVLVAMVGFGAVVLVHEFGHFIVAKFSDIKVEAFSIGFPPTLAGIKKLKTGWRIRLLPDFFEKGEGDVDTEEKGISFNFGKSERKGETEYRIGLIPFGGYVKMLGQEDIGPTKSTDDPRSYSNKSPLVRMAVIAAGVIFNVISALIVFITVFLVGIDLMPAVVGDVVPGSPAERAGLKAGDEIIEIAGKSYNLDFSNIVLAAAFSDTDEPVEMKVRRPDGSVEDFAIVAEKPEGARMKQFGIVSPVGLEAAEVKEAAVLFERTNLRGGDVIKTVEGKEFQTFQQVDKLLRQNFVPEVQVSVQRRLDKDTLQLFDTIIRLDYTCAQSLDASSPSQLYHICSIVPRLKITGVSDVKTAEGGETTILAGDVILAAADINNPTYAELRQLTEKFVGKELPLTVLRKGAAGTEYQHNIEVIPQRKDKRAMIGISLTFDMEHPVVARAIDTDIFPYALNIPSGVLIEEIDGTRVSDFYQIANFLREKAGQRVNIGWRVDEGTNGRVTIDLPVEADFITTEPFLPVPFEILRRPYRAAGFLDAIHMGMDKTWLFVAQSYATIKSLFQRRVSPKELMGPLGIMKLSYDVVASQPIIYFVYVMGMISAIIAVFNFLPFLPFDGGHFLFLLIEKIKGSAVNIRTQEMAARIGWTALLVLFLYVTFFDVLRAFFPTLL
jgi:regulator of sigma E protease